MTYVDLLTKIKNCSATVGVLGIGYVGLPLLIRMVEVGYQCIGFDVREDRVNLLASGESDIKHITSDSVKNAIKDGAQFTFNFSRLCECDVLVICVPTPLTGYREPDLTFVEATLGQIKQYGADTKLICLESTTYPGTCSEVVVPLLDESNASLGEELFVVYSPEREDPGNSVYGLASIPKVVGGVTEKCRVLGEAFYSKVVNQVVPVSSTEAAEMTKLLENIQRSVNIGLVNELKLLCDRMNLDVFEIINAASSKPFGFTKYLPGPGVGGHCIPIDPFYLTWKAREYGLHTRFIELAGEINGAMPEYVVQRLSEALNKRKMPLSGSKILILGIAYKKNVDDMRESNSLELISRLIGSGAKVSYSRPLHTGVNQNT